MLFDDDCGARSLVSRLRGSRENKHDERAFESSNRGPAAATILATIAFGALIALRQSRRNFAAECTGQWTSCGYDSMEQCKRHPAGLSAARLSASRSRRQQGKGANAEYRSSLRSRSARLRRKGLTPTVKKNVVPTSRPEVWPQQ